MTLLFDDFNYTDFDIVIRFQDEMFFHQFKGSFFRGILGKNMRDFFCQNPGEDCRECPDKEECFYAGFFESYDFTDTSIIKKIEKIPHAFVLSYPDLWKRRYLPGTTMAIRLTLIGEGVRTMPYFVAMLREMGKNGLGRTHSRYEIVSVRNQGEELLLPYENGLKFEYESVFLKNFFIKGKTFHKGKIEYLSPVRIKSKGKYHKDISFSMLIRSLFRRIQILNHIYCGGEEYVDFKDYIQKSEEVALIKNQTAWDTRKRVSKRQSGKELSLSGTVGKVVFQGDLTPFYPYLLIGSGINIGSGTALGLGRYQIEMI